MGFLKYIHVPLRIEFNGEKKKYFQEGQNKIEMRQSVDFQNYIWTSKMCCFIYIFVGEMQIFIRFFKEVATQNVEDL